MSRFRFELMHSMPVIPGRLPPPIARITGKSRTKRELAWAHCGIRYQPNHGVAPRECGRMLERRHCEARSDEAIQSFFAQRNGLLRFARNDGSLLNWLFEN